MVRRVEGSWKMSEKLLPIPLALELRDAGAIRSILKKEIETVRQLLDARLRSQVQLDADTTATLHEYADHLEAMLNRVEAAICDVYPHLAPTLAT